MLSLLNHRLLYYYDENYCYYIKSLVLHPSYVLEKMDVNKNGAYQGDIPIKNNGTGRG
jgi:hypothetical protein